jgi:hypothetical protein
VVHRSEIQEGRKGAPPTKRSSISPVGPERRHQIF